MAGDDQDKTEQATPFKLEESRKKGMVAKSLDVTTFVMIAVFLLALAAFGSWIQRGVFSYSRDLFLLAGSMNPTGVGPLEILAKAAKEGLFVLSPLLAVAVLGGILANVLQSRPTFTTFPLKPDFSKLNPAQGLKRLFSGRTLFETFKSLVKLLLLTVISWICIRALAGQALSLPTSSLGRAVVTVMPPLTKLAYGLLFALFVIALIDYRYTVWEFAKKMRMSRRELKDEYKRREGDPLVRSKRREQQNAFRKKLGSIQKVAESDFVVTNPTHFAVAIRYKRETMAAPKVVSKGAGELALKIREEAHRHNIPVVQSPALARHLYDKTELDSFIPESAYEGVAAVMFALYRPRKDT